MKTKSTKLTEAKENYGEIYFISLNVVGFFFILKHNLLNLKWIK